MFNSHNTCIVILIAWQEVLTNWPLWHHSWVMFAAMLLDVANSGLNSSEDEEVVSVLALQIHQRPWEYAQATGLSCHGMTPYPAYGY